jgi:hypothetical protein
MILIRPNSDLNQHHQTPLDKMTCKNNNDINLSSNDSAASITSSDSETTGSKHSRHYYNHLHRRRNNPLHVQQRNFSKNISLTSRHHHHHYHAMKKKNYMSKQQKQESIDNMKITEQQLNQKNTKNSKLGLLKNIKKLFTRNKNETSNCNNMNKKSTTSEDLNSKSKILSKLIVKQKIPKNSNTRLPFIATYLSNESNLYTNNIKTIQVSIFFLKHWV